MDAFYVMFLDGVYEYVGQSIFKLLMSQDIWVRPVKTAKNIGNWNIFFPHCGFFHHHDSKSHSTLSRSLFLVKDRDIEQCGSIHETEL